MIQKLNPDIFRANTKSDAPNFVFMNQESQITSGLMLITIQVSTLVYQITVQYGLVVLGGNCPTAK